MKKHPNPPPPQGAKPPPPPAPPPAPPRGTDDAAELRTTWPVGATAVRTLELALRLADEAAEVTIYANCSPVREPDTTWWRPLRFIDTEKADRAIEYMLLRGIVEHDPSGKMVRFTEPQP